VADPLSWVCFHISGVFFLIYFKPQKGMVTLSSRKVSTHFIYMPSFNSFLKAVHPVGTTTNIYQNMQMYFVNGMSFALYLAIALESTDFNTAQTWVAIF